MSKLTPEQMAVGRQRFLDGKPEVKRRIQELTAAHADALGISLDRYRELEIMRELEEEARARGEDSMELFFSYIAETADEFDALVEQRRAAIKKTPGFNIGKQQKERCSYGEDRLSEHG